MSPSTPNIDFCQRWLAAWTGNRPHDLIGFYDDEAFYRDPGRPNGLRGKADLLAYFTKLLAKFPDWKWSLTELFPTEKGFVLKWTAVISPGKSAQGMDIVELKDGKISRNEVYFDPSVLRPD